MLKVSVDKDQFDLVVEELSKGNGSIDGKPFEYELQKVNDIEYQLTRNGKTYRVFLLERNDNSVVLQISHYQFEVTATSELFQLIEKLGLSKNASGKLTEIRSPMPGKVISITANNKQSVSKGDELIILEAMKMENIIKSPVDCIIKNINVKAGDSVNKDDVLITFE